MIKINSADIPSQVYISDVSDHKNIKLTFFDLLDKFPVLSIKENNFQNIYNTDYFCTNFYKFNYDFFIPVADQHNYALSIYLQYDHQIKTSHIWYQQYAKNGFHSWHKHNDVFSNVYYVDLPEDSSKTSFRFRGEEFEVDVEEGQILTFPSYLEHCSKPNLSDKIKTVIAFNST